MFDRIHMSPALTGILILVLVYFVVQLLPVILFGLSIGLAIAAYEWWDRRKTNTRIREDLEKINNRPRRGKSH